MWRCLWTLLAILTYVSGEYLMGGHLDNNAGAKPRSVKIDSSFTSGHLGNLDLVPEDSTIATASSASIDDDALRYHIPYPFVFNGGKPFSLEKDPITGKIDFEKAPPVRALNYTSHYHEPENKEDESISEETGSEKDSAERKKAKDKDKDDVGSNEINTYVSNFHNFFNLPIHYSSDKYGNDKYPLISNSYANTKVQSGPNSYSIYNHRPYHSESDFYAYPTKSSYASMTKTSAHKTAITNNNIKTRWTSATSLPSTTPSTANSSKTMLLTSTKASIITTWTPPSTTLTTPHSLDRTITEEGKEKYYTIPKIEKSQASDRKETHQVTNNVLMQLLNDRTTTEKAQASYKDQSNLDNFLLSHTGTEIKPSVQNEEYRDSYDIYESLDDGEDIGEGDDGNGNSESNDRDANGNRKESDYFLPFRDTSKEGIMPTHFAIISNATASTDATTIANTTTMSSVGTTTTSTVSPLGFASSTLFSLQENMFASNPPQPSTVSSSPSSDRMQSVTERYDSMTGQEYRSTPTIMSEQNKIGTGAVIESTSNIIIPPDQDTVSFVLGNRQNVNGGYYSVGTAIGENPYGSLSDIDTSFWPPRNTFYSPAKEVKHSPVSIAELHSDHVVQKWWSPASSALKNNNELEATISQDPFLVTSSAVIEDTKNQSKEQDSGYVIFPDAQTKDKNTMMEERIVLANEADSGAHELPSKSTLTTTTRVTAATNKTKINHISMSGISEDLPQLAENLMPPAESSTSPSYYYHQYDTLRPDHSRPPQRLPLPPHIKPHSGLPPLDIGLRRRPYSPDTKLPNILPQFRPNAKASHGHRFGSDAIGTTLAGQSPSTRTRQSLQSHSSSRRPLPPPPSYFQRLNPPPPPIHAIRLALSSASKMDSVALPLETDTTIRRFHPSHVSSVPRGSLKEKISSNRLYDHSANQNEGEDVGVNNGESKKQSKSKNEIIGENQSSEKYLEEPSMTPPRPPLFPKRRTADPPRIATLQMLQHYGEFGEGEAPLAQPVESVLAHQSKHKKSDNHDPAETDEQPVYVVYPVNTAVNIHPDDSNEKDGSVVVGTRGPHRPLPPDTLLQDEQKKVHTVYNGRPVAVDFPYPLERPDPSSMFPATVKETPLLIPSDQRQETLSAFANERENGKDKQDAVNVIPYLQDFLPYQRKDDAAISATLQRVAPTSTSVPTLSTLTPTPIAYVYTPKQAAHPIHRFDDDADVAASSDSTATILLPSQQPSSSSSSAPAPQNFMAPFVASISAEAPPKNGWSVIVVEPPSGADKRLDSDNNDAKLGVEIETQTEEKNEFDTDNFKPQLFGGFQPIYEFPNEDMEHHDVIDTNTDTDSKLSIPDKG